MNEQIRCQTLWNTEELEVDENGRFWPCCFVNTAEAGGATGRNDSYHNDWYMDTFNKNWNSLKHNTYTEILAHPMFTKHYNDEHWGDDELCSPVCKKECITGRNFEAVNLKTNPQDYQTKKKWIDLKLIDFGLTTYCQAGCTGCPRTDSDTRKHYDWFVPKHLPKDDLLKYLLSGFETFHNLHRIKFCGDRGDPMMHPHIEPIIDTICDKTNNSPLRKYDDRKFELRINTNGGIRNPDCYERIAKYDNICLTFSIDGFEDTNEIYRYGVDFTKVWDNFTTYCESGGGRNACWDFLVFKHNWHEIPRVKEEAARLNIGDVSFKITNQGKHMDSNYNTIVESVDRDFVDEVKALINE